MEIRKLKGSQSTDMRTLEPGVSLTFGGESHNLLKLKPEDFKIEYVAKSLARIARYYGQTHKFYSVAQHCVYMARTFMLLGDVHRAFICMVHDQTEFIFGDVKGPLKKLLPDYRALEDTAEKILAEKYGLEYPWDDEVMRVDKNISQWEQTVMIYNDLFSDYWDCDKAEAMFMETWNQIERFKQIEVTLLTQ